LTAVWAGAASQAEAGPFLRVLSLQGSFKIVAPIFDRRTEMHAVFVRVTINDPERALKALHEEVVPRVSGLPGLVAGYWLRPEANQGRSLVVFESEEAARAAAENVRANAPEFVTMDTVDVVEVVAHT
jgi:hypothetical protein